MSFLEHFQPAPNQLRMHKQRRQRPHFHGRMSLRCLLEAAENGAATLLTYLLVWHAHFFKKQEWVELNDETCSLAGLSEHRRQSALRDLARKTGLIEVERRPGRPARVRPTDPWPDSPYFMGYMSFDCLVQAAASQPKGKALAVYVITWHEFNLARRRVPIRLGKRQREMLRLGRSSWNRAVNELRNAGLLKVYSQRAGASPLVLPLDPWRPDFDTGDTAHLTGEVYQSHAPPALAAALAANRCFAG
jgi:hypothetical protein